MIASGVVRIFNCFLIGEIREHKLSEHYIPVTTAELVSAEIRLEIRLEIVVAFVTGHE